MLSRLDAGTWLEIAKSADDIERDEGIAVMPDTLAELCRVYLAYLDAPVVDVYEMHDGRIVTDAPGLLNGKRLRLVTDAEAK